MRPAAFGSALYSAWPALVTIVITGFPSLETCLDALQLGATNYLVKPFQRSELIPAVEVALGVFKEMKALHDQTANLEEQLETRKIVDRAKGQIMDAHGLSEHEAFSFIQKRAMQERQTMKAVAERVIAGELTPPPASP